MLKTRTGLAVLKYTTLNIQAYLKVIAYYIYMSYYVY